LQQVGLNGRRPDVLTPEFPQIFPAQPAGLIGEFGGACGFEEAARGGRRAPGGDGFAEADGDARGADASAGLAGLDDADEAGERADGGVAGDGGVGFPGGVGLKLAEDQGAAGVDGTGDGGGRVVGEEALRQDDEGFAAGMDCGEMGAGVDAARAATDDCNVFGGEEGRAIGGKAGAGVGGVACADDGCGRFGKQIAAAFEEDDWRHGGTEPGQG